MGNVDETDFPDWADYAACIGTDPLYFFPEDANGKQAVWYQERGIEICQGCPVRLQCLQYALDNRIDEGTWGGMTHKQRKQILKRRKGIGS